MTNYEKEEIETRENIALIRELAERYGLTVTEMMLYLMMQDIGSIIQKLDYINDTVNDIDRTLGNSL